MKILRPQARRVFAKGRGRVVDDLVYSGRDMVDAALAGDR